MRYGLLPSGVFLLGLVALGGCEKAPPPEFKSYVTSFCRFAELARSVQTAEGRMSVSAFRSTIRDLERSQPGLPPQGAEPAGELHAKSEALLEACRRHLDVCQAGLQTGLEGLQRAAAQDSASQEDVNAASRELLETVAAMREDSRERAKSFERLTEALSTFLAT